MAGHSLQLKDVEDKRLDLEDISDVMDAMEDVAVHYKSIGVALRVKYAELANIEAKYGYTGYHNVRGGLRAVLEQWLKSNYVKKETDYCPYPCWRKVVEVVEKSWAGNNHALAMDIATRHIRGVGATVDVGGEARMGVKSYSNQERGSSNMERDLANPHSQSMATQPISNQYPPQRMSRTEDPPQRVDAPPPQHTTSQPTDQSSGHQLVVTPSNTIPKNFWTGDKPPDPRLTQQLPPTAAPTETPPDVSVVTGGGQGPAQHLNDPSQSSPGGSLQEGTAKPPLKKGGNYHKDLAGAQPPETSHNGNFGQQMPPTGGYPLHPYPHQGQYMPPYPLPYPYGPGYYPAQPFPPGQGGPGLVPMYWPQAPPQPNPPPEGSAVSPQGGTAVAGLSPHSSPALETGEENVHFSQEAESKDQGKFLRETILSYENVEQTVLTDKGTPSQASDSRKALLYPPYERDCQFNKIYRSYSKVIEPVRPDEGVRKPEHTYDMKKSPHGFAIIINNNKFKEHSTRDGTEKDCKDLIVTFKYLGYIVEVYKDLSAADIRGTIAEIRDRNHDEFDSFICCILSHGGNNVVYGSDSKPVAVKDLASQLNAGMCSSLAGKPKLFFIQACRGLKKSSGIQVDGDDDVDIPTEKPGLLPEEDSFPSHKESSVVTDANVSPIADFLVAYSTSPDYVSYRDINSGSWYIQELCDALCEWSTCKTLTEIITIVHRKVNDGHDKSGEKQAPEFTSQLRNQVFFWQR